MKTNTSNRNVNKENGPNGELELFYGLLGDVTKLIEPQTEADPLAIYLQLIVGFGNYIGRKAFFEIEATKHYTNLFANIVGDSSISRKGTAGDYAKRFFTQANPFYGMQFVEGISTGEGLIWYIRDGEPTIIDKRLLVMETEFARVLKLMRRPHDILSVVLRNAWDCKSPLRTITKHESARATNAHISIVGHITEEELQKEMADCDVFNGFANRFLWLSVKRSKILPLGGKLDWKRFDQYVERLKQICKQVKAIEKMNRDKEAEEYYAAEYPNLTNGESGMLGAATNRAAPQVVRLSMIFALADCSSTISVRHQQAAFALWNCCFQSANKFFGSKIKNKHAQKIFDELKKTPEGMTRTEIGNDIFNNNLSKDQLNAALLELTELKLVYCQPEPTGGRSAQRYFVKLVFNS